MSAPPIEFCALDFESAGAAKGATDEPVQIGWARWRDGAEEVEGLFSSYLQVSRPVTWAAQRVHGITTAHLAGAPALTSLWPQVREALAGRVLVAHGAGTEKRFLRAFPLHGFGPWLDTVTLARRYFPQLPDYSLAAVCAHLGLEGEASRYCPQGRWHDALFDAVACLLIVRKVAREIEPAAHLVRQFAR